MNKAELVEAIASDTKFSKTDVRKTLDAFIRSTTKSLKRGERVALVGFGSFTVTNRKARTGRNPKTGETVPVPAKKIVKFKPGEDLSHTIA